MKSYFRFSLLITALLIVIAKNANADVEHVGVCTTHVASGNGGCDARILLNNIEVKTYFCCDPTETGKDSCSPTDRTIDQAAALADTDAKKLEAGGVCIYLGPDEQ